MTTDTTTRDRVERRLPEGWVPTFNGGAILLICPGLDPLVVQRQSSDGPWVAKIRRQVLGELGSAEMYDRCGEADTLFRRWAKDIPVRHAAARGLGEASDDQD